jgi:hypothetical protein
MPALNRQCNRRRYSLPSQCGPRSPVTRNVSRVASSVAIFAGRRVTVGLERRASVLGHRRTVQIGPYNVSMNASWSTPVVSALIAIWASCHYADVTYLRCLLRRKWGRWWLIPIYLLVLQICVLYLCVFYLRVQPFLLLSLRLFLRLLKNLLCQLLNQPISSLS